MRIFAYIITAIFLAVTIIATTQIAKIMKRCIEDAERTEDENL